MTTLFKDTFTGTGGLNGHTPDTTFGGFSWTESDGNLALVGGSLVGVDTVAYGWGGMIGDQVSYAGTGNGSVDQTLKFDITTGDDLANNSVWWPAWVRVDTYFGDNGYYFDLGFYSGGLRLRLGGNGSSYGEIDRFLSLPAANTTYPVEITFKADGDITVSAFGETNTFTEGTDATGFLPGLRHMRVFLAPGWKLNELWMADSFPVETGIVIAAVLTAPLAEVLIDGDIYSEVVIPATATLTAPQQTLTASATGSIMADAALSAPYPLLSSAATDTSNTKYAALTAPMQVLQLFGGATSSMVAPSQALDAAGTVALVATVAAAAPKPTLESTAKSTSVAAAPLQGPIQALVGFSGAVCSVTIGGKAELQAYGGMGGVGHMTVVAPLFDLTASATRQNSGSAILAAPSPRMATTGAAWIIAPGATLTAIGHAVVTATYEAYALNLNHTPRYSAGKPVEPTDELTHYTNFPFHQIVRYKNSYFGVAADGLYLLEGTTDDGAPIAWDVQTAFSDFDSPNLKTLNSAYFGGRFGPATTITVLVGEASTQPYAYTTPRGAAAQNHRQAFGRGNKARYYAVGAEGTGEVTIDSVNFNIATLARRI